MNAIQTRISSFFSESKNWAMVYLFVIYLDALMTIIGTHQPGLGEANPVIRYAILTGDFRPGLLSAASILLVMFLILKGWNAEVKEKHNPPGRAIRVLRLAAWLLIPAYFYFTSFSWMYLLSFKSMPPFYGYFLTALERLL